MPNKCHWGLKVSGGMTLGAEHSSFQLDAVGK